MALGGRQRRRKAGQEVQEGSSRPKGDADADRRQQPGERDGSEETSGEVAAEVGIAFPMVSRKLQSAGLLLFRGSAADLEVLLGHPGGPFRQNKDDGAWSIPKGLIGADEAPLSAARREFVEETDTIRTGISYRSARLGSPAAKSFKHGHRGRLGSRAHSQQYLGVEWPPRSGRRRTFPEIDRAAWFGIADVRRGILKGQTACID